MSLPCHLLPDFIALQQLQGRRHGTFRARTLFLDLSGFTALTETLMREGKLGAEKLSSILNDIFAPLVEIVYQQGGFIPYFAGDAFTAIFPEEEGEAMQRSLRAALLLRHFFFDRHCRFDRFEIGFKMGLGCGQIEWGIVGGKLKAWYFRGPAIQQSIHCQARAGSREIVFHRNFLTAATSLSYTPKNGEENLFLLEHQTLPPQAPPLPQKELPAEKRKEVAPLFLPDALLDVRREGEFRSVVSVFTAFRLPTLSGNPAAENKQMDRFASTFLRRVRHFRAYFKEIDYGDKGGLMLAFFGAPVTFENNVERALEFALTLRRDWEAEFGSDCFRMGITNGIAFTGLIGGQKRCQYAAVGRHVNLAARLMTEAKWGEILTDENIAKNKLFLFQDRGNISYKGIPQPVPTFQLTGKNPIDELMFEGPLIGREEELNDLLQFARKRLKEKKGSIIAITGEAGSGKSRLAWEVCQNLQGQNQARWLFAPADQILRKPFFPFREMLKKFFQLPTEEPPEKQAARFASVFPPASPAETPVSSKEQEQTQWELQQLKPAFLALLELPQEDQSWEKLNSRSRHENILAALRSFFLSQAQTGPLLLELEDLQSLDPESEDFLRQLMPLLQEQPVLLLLTSRYEEDGSLPSLLSEKLPLPLHLIRLENLSLEAMRSFAESELGGPIAEDFLRLLERTTNGNPFYLEQLLEYFRESQLLTREENGNWNILDQNIRLSHSIHAILTARLDRLSELVRETVKAAAVIGREFELPVLTEVMKNYESFEYENRQTLPTLLKEQVHTAEKVQIWRAVNELRYIFKHSLLREAVYEMQLRARLKHLHLLIAQAIEKIHADETEQYLSDLVYHYEQSGHLAKAKIYGKQAADFFRNNYQNRQALLYYDKLLNWSSAEENPLEYFNLLLRKAEMLELLGQWQDAEGICRKALKIAKKETNPIVKARAANALGKLLMLQGKYAEADKHLQKSRKLFEAENDLYGKIRAYGNLGNLYFRQGAYEKAKKYFIKSIEGSRQRPYSSATAQVVANLGLAFMNQGRYTEGIRWIKEQLDICRKAKDRQGMATLLVNLGILLFEKGDYEQAGQQFQEGLQLAEELGNKFLMAIALGSLGNVFQKQKKYNKARELYLRDLKLVKEMGDRQGRAIVLLYLGELESLTGEYEQALQHLRESLKICQQLNYQKGIARAINTMGDVFYHQQKYEQALEAYERAIAIAREINNLLVLASSLCEKALTLQALHQNTEAIQTAREAQKIAEKIKHKELLRDISRLLK